MNKKYNKQNEGAYLSIFFCLRYGKFDTTALQVSRRKSDSSKSKLRFGDDEYAFPFS